MRSTNITDFSTKDVLNLMSDTAQIVREAQADNFLLSLLAADEAGFLTNEVEFWKWFGQNYRCMASADKIKEIVNRSPKGIRVLIQGKGYEWDFMSFQRRQWKNLFKRFDAGTDPTQRGIDITETSVLNGQTTGTYQAKAYTSENTPDLHTTPKSTKVVTNAEKAQAVEEMGYEVTIFQDNDTIKSQTDARMKRAAEGKAYSTYMPAAVIGTMTKAGLGAAVIGMGIETIASYRQYRRGDITKEEYLKEILKTGALTGITGAGTAGIMIPISSVVTAAGISQLWTIPVSFVVSEAISKIIAPAFGRGEYARLLGEAQYYQSLAAMYQPLMLELDSAADQYTQYIKTVTLQRQKSEILFEINEKLNDLQQRANERIRRKIEKIEEANQ